MLNRLAAVAFHSPLAEGPVSSDREDGARAEAAEETVAGLCHICFSIMQKINYTDFSYE